MNAPRLASLLGLTATLVAALAVLPGCRSRRACCPPAPSVAMAPAPAPVYMPSPTPSVSRDDLLRVDDKVSAVGAQVQELDSKVDRIALQPAPLPPPMAAYPTAPAAAPAPFLEPARELGEGDASRFAETLRARGVDADQRGSRVVVRLTDAFRQGSDSLKGDVGLAKALQAVAEGLQVAPQARVQVVGHTDLTPIRKGSWQDNTHLSRARAQTVARVLSENGVRAYIDVDGRGESEPLVSPERSRSDQARNRRVDVEVTFS